MEKLGQSTVRGISTSLCAALGALLLAAVPAVGQNPAYGQYPQNQQYPVNRPPSGYGAPNAIPEGTRFIAVLDDKLDTKKLSSGKKFKMKLAEDLVAPNGQIIPRGKKIKGHVSSVDRGLRGRVLLSFDQIETNHGWVPLIATVTGVPGEHGVDQTMGSEGEIQKRGTDKKRAIESAVIGAGIGAAAGAAAGGAKGAAIGAAAGGALGTGAGILTDRDMVLDKGTQMELTLDRQLQVPN
jgi:hypothetical protein